MNPSCLVDIFICIFFICILASWCFVPIAFELCSLMDALYSSCVCVMHICVHTHTLISKIQRSMLSVALSCSTCFLKQGFFNETEAHQFGLAVWLVKSQRSTVSSPKMLGQQTCCYARLLLNTRVLNPGLILAQQGLY